jgi:transitional endoplasmic reticulum ATPase
VELLFLLLLFGLPLLMIVTFVRRMAAARREAEEERRRRAEALAREGGAPAVDPFAMFPFGGLFGDLLSGAGARSYAYDPETGRWIDITDQEPEAIEEPEPERAPTNAEESAATREAERKRRRSERRRRASRTAAPANPLAGLLGGGAMGGMGGMGGGGEFDVQPPEELTTFEDVGGMERLKEEIRDTVGLVLQRPEEAERYGIEWNGILLHGPPGVGKTFFAGAIAGEYDLNFIHVSTGDLVSSLVGGSAQNIQKAFDTAVKNLPCLLFFDEFDSVAQRREGTPDQESRRTVNQLLTSLEAHRGERGLLVMAATNSIEHLDPAVVRPGRFDRHIRIDLPDAEARRAIFVTELDERPTAEAIELDALVQRTEGMTPAAIEKVVDMAALDVFRQASETGEQLELDTAHLLSAIERYGGQDRPTVEHWSWDSLILPSAIKAQLQQIQAVIEDPESARRFGVDPPTGLLLAGPPGTGKTTVAKVLAAQARCSFYPISGADVVSKWVGESERNIRRLFERARENRPSIIFIDEIDAIAGRRGESLGVHDSHVNQLLAEIDGVAGQRGVFIVGATNRPDQLDPALLRGGRLSRTIVLGLPDEAGRLAMLRLHTARMPTVAVRFEELARETDGMSPADLKALAQEAALVAMARTGTGGNGDAPAAAPAVTHEDFTEALKRLREGAVAETAPF